MLSVAECRKILGKVASNYTDEQIEEMRGTLYGLADLTINRYLREIEEKKTNTDSPPIEKDSPLLAEKPRNRRR
jgi:hypothetical protein